jgi:hypothetical protein
MGGALLIIVCKGSRKPEIVIRIKIIRMPRISKIISVLVEIALDLMSDKDA